MQVFTSPSASTRGGNLGKLGSVHQAILQAINEQAELGRAVSFLNQGATLCLWGEIQ